MKVTRRFAHRFRLLRLLRAILSVAGALLLAAAAVALVAPDALARYLGVPFGAEPVFAWLFAAVLIPLGGSYFPAARDPRRYSAVSLVAILAQALLALALGAGALRGGGGALWLPAGAALALALAIAGAWLPLRI